MAGAQELFLAQQNRPGRVEGSVWAAHCVSAWHKGTWCRHNTFSFLGGEHPVRLLLVWLLKELPETPLCACSEPFWASLTNGTFARSMFGIENKYGGQSELCTDNAGHLRWR